MSDRQQVLAFYVAVLGAIELSRKNGCHPVVLYKLEGEYGSTDTWQGPPGCEIICHLSAGTKPIALPADYRKALAKEQEHQRALNASPENAECPCGNRTKFIGHDDHGYGGPEMCACGAADHNDTAESTPDLRVCSCETTLSQPYTVRRAEDGSVIEFDYQSFEGGGFDAEIGNYTRIDCAACGKEVYRDEAFANSLLLPGEMPVGGVVESRLVKVAVIRDPSVPPGQPAPMWLNCPCGAKPATKSVRDTNREGVVVCVCGREYSYDGVGPTSPSPISSAVPAAARSARRAGLRVRMAMNHWDLAVETHNTNFPTPITTAATSRRAIRGAIRRRTS
jgi:hypothetical protein